MDAIKTALLAEYPTIPVLIKAASAGAPGKIPQPGWTAGSQVPCFCISELDAEKVDQSATFELITLGYPVVVEFVKSSAPKGWLDDPDVRTKRIELEDLLYTNGLAGIPANVFDVRFGTLPVYAGNAAEDVVISAVVLTYTLTRARPDA